jgi:dolichol-phosphate mannosyltransferase
MFFTYSGAIMGNIISSIVIPTLNEKENIMLLLEELENSGLEDFEIIVVDSNSSDGTSEAVEKYAYGKDNIRCIKDNVSHGLSPSIVMGFENAYGNYLVCMDGDLQHAPKDVLKLLKAIENHDFVIGSRYVPGGGFAEKWIPVRVIISRTASFLAELFLKINVKDPMSGFFAIRKTTFEEIKNRLNPKGFKIMLEMLYLLQHSDTKKYSFCETGIIFRKRIYGKSKLNYKVIFQYLSMLFSLRKI